MQQIRKPPFGIVRPAQSQRGSAPVCPQCGGAGCRISVPHGPRVFPGATPSAPFGKVTEEDICETGRIVFGIRYPGDEPKRGTDAG